MPRFSGGSSWQVHFIAPRSHINPRNAQPWGDVVLCLWSTCMAALGSHNNHHTPSSRVVLACECPTLAWVRAAQHKSHMSCCKPSKTSISISDARPWGFADSLSHSTRTLNRIHDGSPVLGTAAQSWGFQQCQQSPTSPSEINTNTCPYIMELVAAPYWNK